MELLETHNLVVSLFDKRVRSPKVTTIIKKIPSVLNFPGYSEKEKIYNSLVYNTKIPLCKCGNELPYYQDFKGYKKFCNNCLEIFKSNTAGRLNKLHTKESESKRFESRRETMIESGTWNSMYEKSTVNMRLKRLSKSRFKDTDLYYDSKLELKWLNTVANIDDLENNKIIEYECTKYSKTRKYYADFYIKSSNTIVEIKNLWILENRTSYRELYDKFKSCLAKGYNILLVLDEKDIYIENLEELENISMGELKLIELLETHKAL